MAKHTTFKSFGKAVKANAKKIRDDAEKKVRAAALAGLRTAQQVTPVDQGRAKGNWHLQNNLNNSVTFEADAPVSLSLSALGKYKSGDTIYLTNNLEYIVPLDNGSSQQAPAGMTPSILTSIKLTLGK